MGVWSSNLMKVRVFSADRVLQFELGPSEGNLALGEENAENHEHVEIFDRGDHFCFIEGNQLSPSVSISLMLPTVTLTDPIISRATDVFKRQNAWAAAASVDGTIWAFIMEVELSDGVVTTLKTLPKVRGGISFAEAGSGAGVTLTFNGTSHAAIIDS